MPNLNDYAGTIEQVFKKIAASYGPMQSGYLHDIHTILDADTCAEIIEAAKEQDEPANHIVQ